MTRRTRQTQWDATAEAAVNSLSATLLVVGIAAVSVLPLWATPVVPTQDGPTHLYNAWVIAYLHDPSLHLDAHFKLVPFLPYWGGLAPLLPLLAVLDPFTAEKLFLSVIIAGIALSAASLARRAGGDSILAATTGASWPTVSCSRWDLPAIYSRSPKPSRWRRGVAARCSRRGSMRKFATRPSRRSH